MCNWCKKETIGIPRISSASIPMICEHCGTSINKRLSHNNARKWASEFIASQKNPSGQDALIKVEVYLCRACGHEYGQPIVQDNRVAPDKLKCNCEYNEPRSLTGYWVCDVHGQMKR